MQLALDRINLRVGGEQHLADIDLTLKSGSLNMLLGPTQAGKTSLLRVMAGLDAPSHDIHALHRLRGIPAGIGEEHPAVNSSCSRIGRV